MKNQSGFTLIELVITIIILGILAVVAAPKFINLGSDARVASLQALKGSIDSANSMVHAKSQLAGNFKLAGGEEGATVDLGNGVTQNIAYGYIPATVNDVATALDIKIVAETSAASGSGSNSNPGAGEEPELAPEWYGKADITKGTIILRQAGSPATCVITYTQAKPSTPPSFSAMPASTDC